MLILPIVNKNRVLNVQVTLKDASKIKRGVNYEDAKSSDIIVNGSKFSDSKLSESKDYNSIVNFVRSNTMLYRRSYLITTNNEAGTSLYDVYEVAPPPRKVNDKLDNLYGRVLTDMRKELPGENKGKYLSLEKIGLDEDLTDEKISKLQNIVERYDSNMWPTLFQKEGIADLMDTIEFLRYFDCTVISDTTIPEESLQDSLKALSILKTRDFKQLNKYYEMALSNRRIYARLSYINKLVNDEPLNLIQSHRQKEKRLVKTKEEMDFINAA